MFHLRVLYLEDRIGDKDFMAKRINKTKIVKQRYKYFQYVYKKYIYNVFTEFNRPTNEQIILGMEEHNTNPKILEDYINQNSFSQGELEIMNGWKNEIYGDMHVISITENKVMLFHEQSDCIYQVDVLYDDFKQFLKTIGYFVRFHGTIFTIYGKQYIDNIINIESDSADLPFIQCEELYEHIYQLILNNPQLMSNCPLFTYRTLNKEKFSNIFIDYLGPCSPLSMDEADLEHLLKLGYVVWNDEYMDDIDVSPLLEPDIVQFLKERKKKYFSQFDIVIIDYDVNYHDHGFQLITHTMTLDEYKKSVEEEKSLIALNEK